MMAVRHTKRSRIVICESVNPIYRVMLDSYTTNLKLDLVTVPHKDCHTDMEAMLAALDGDTAAIIVQNPNFFGTIQDFTTIFDKARELGIVSIISTYPIMQSILKTPGRMGADIAVAEGQSLGLPLSFGGPYLGIMACNKQLIRQMPGRIAGRTVDKNGQTGFVLTLQAREQHIRREKATSNICSNEALCALAAGVYLAALGKNLRKLALLNVYKAQYLKARLLQIPGWAECFSSPVYNEFTVFCPDAQTVNEKLKKEGIIGGYELATDYPELESALVFCVTEMVSKDDMDQIIRILK